ncbi:MAG: hypothetical protein ACRC1M_06710 [Methanobacteriaceae archaeon]
MTTTAHRVARILLKELHTEHIELCKAKFIEEFNNTEDIEHKNDLLIVLDVLGEF